jgi:hypothetical protein
LDVPDLISTDGRTCRVLVRGLSMTWGRGSMLKTWVEIDNEELTLFEYFFYRTSWVKRIRAE